MPFKFDGVQFIGADGAARLYAFLVRPSEENKYRLDGENDGQTFWGVYGSAPTGWTLPGTVDLYYLGVRYANQRYVSGSGAELRHSVGTRWSGRLGNWSYDWEPIVQFGKFGNREIFAWTVATDTGYTFTSTPLKPRLGFKADIASGDSAGPGGRFGAFNPLFFKSGYFNDASLIRPTNIADLHPSLQFVPTSAVTATIASDFLWRYSRKDGVYGPGGNIELQPLAGSRYIGNTAEFAAQWKISRHIVGTASYVHLFASNDVKAAGGHSVDYVGTWVSFNW